MLSDYLLQEKNDKPIKIHQKHLRYIQRRNED